jgi:hypothetical protein
MPRTTRKQKQTTSKKTRISKLAQCIRKTVNTVRLRPQLMPDYKTFNASNINPEMSVKFTAIINKIKELDAADMHTHGTHYKHFIFTDIRESAYGVKALASFLIAAGFDFRMGLKEKYIRRGGKLVKTVGGDTVYIEKQAVPKGGNGFAILQSLPLWKNPLSVTTKKTILKAFNQRPENVHGEHLRIIVLDSKFKEGIDLFDVKYVHLVEPAIATSDLKQAVGRATRFCGQKGLPFLPRHGWPLQVFVYNTVLPNRAPFSLDGGEVDGHALVLAKSGLDLALLNLTKELTILAIKSAVDYDLAYKINNFKITEALVDDQTYLAFHTLDAMTPALVRQCASRKSELFPFTVKQLQEAAAAVGLKIPKNAKREIYCERIADTPAYFKHLVETFTPDSPTLFPTPAKAPSPSRKTLTELYALPPDKFQRGIIDLYSKFKWASPVVKNGCDTIAAGKHGQPVSFTQTQDFVRHYLTPSSPFKGLLAWHSVGTGKTCMAVAAATTEFEKAGYTILWVTRNSLMSDVYKNIFGSVCSIPMMEAIKDGKKIPEDITKAKRMLSRAWFPPISYRTFQNALEKKNELGRILHAKHGADPLHKTFLIMDEVHKLQDGDLGAVEAADFSTIQRFIQKSYSTSEENSVRPLLMTATPISDTPKELFEILNTLIADESMRFMEFNEFRSKYTDSKGAISEEGTTYFQERAKGLISYLNREFDPTTFSQPEFHSIRVPIADPILPTSAELVSKCLVEPHTTGADASAVDTALNARISEAFIEVDCRAGFDTELAAIDDAITQAEQDLIDIGDEKPAVTEAKKKVAELKKLFSTTKKNQKERERQCLLANKEGNEFLKKFSRHSRKKTRQQLYADFKNCFKQQESVYKKALKESQLRSVEECFEGGIKKEAQFMKMKDFMAEVKRRFPLNH